MEFSAAILVETGKDLVVDAIEWNEDLGPGQVLVRIFLSGICGAQINEIDAAKGPDKFLPHLLGHEGLGEVVAVGPLVNSVKMGDRVVLHWMPGSGVQSQPPSYMWQGRKLNAGWVTTLSDYAVVSENRLTPVVTEFDPLYLPLFGCAATTAWGSLVNDAQMRLGESVVVLGVGGVGLLTVEAARAGGASPIVAVDLLEERASSALTMGASCTLVSTRVDLEERIVEILGPKGAEVVIETTGASSMIELAYRLGARGGRVVLVGVPRHDDPIQIDSLPLHFGMRFTGSKGGSVDPSLDIPRLVEMAVQGIYRVNNLPITEIELAEVNDGITNLRRSSVGRIVVRMSD